MVTLNIPLKVGASDIVEIKDEYGGIKLLDTQYKTFEILGYYVLAEGVFYPAKIPRMNELPRGYDPHLARSPPAYRLSSAYKVFEGRIISGGASDEAFPNPIELEQIYPAEYRGKKNMWNTNSEETKKVELLSGEKKRVANMELLNLYNKILIESKKITT